jgi:5-methylcytosine-specific restriction endonuclease McrA
MVEHSYNPSWLGGGNRRIMVQGWPRQMCQTLCKNKNLKKSKRKRGMAQVRDHEFNSQYYQKINK